MAAATVAAGSTLVAAGGKMAERVDPWRNADGLQRVAFPAGLEVGTPRGHAVLRYKDFRKVFAALYAMRRQGMLPLGAVAIRGAHNQFNEGRGTRADRTQGAHNLPRQLTIGGRTIEEWLRDGGADPVMILSIVGTEGVAVVLPEAWNKADSLWEMKGLDEAFRAAAAEIVAWGPGSAAAAFGHFPAMWSVFHSAAGAALGRALVSVGAGDARLGPLQTYQQVHLAEGQSFNNDPPDLHMLLGLDLR
ncbi:hypothetical protein [Roseomonas sp. BN140053]|uniref:hypothetical protein n=1 Tax=Roseomonas sp. BN140053 TaxID=3391898 RepID=UPI0039E95A33